MRTLLAVVVGLASVLIAAAAPVFTQDEIDVLRAHFAADALAKSPVILSRFSSVGIREPGRDWKSRLRQDRAKHGADIQQAIDDFIVQNESASSFEHLKLQGVTLKTLSDAEVRAIFAAKDEDGWEIFRRRFSSSTLHSVSRVGFSKDRVVAIYFAYAQHDWLEGGGHFRVLRKRDGKWIEDGSISVGWSIVS